MPPRDSLTLKLSELDKKISALADSTAKLKEYINYQPDDHPSNNDIAFTIFICSIPTFFFIRWLVFTVKAYRTNKKLRDLKITDLKNEHTTNLFWVLIWILGVTGIGLMLYSTGKIHFPKGEFTVSHVDLILAVASIIAVVGAVWAVYARIDAERAFQESRKTRLSFGNSFKFDSIIHDESMLNYIVEEIGTKGSIVSLYLGFPIVGWFCKGFNRIESLNFISKLQNLLQEKILNPIKDYEDFRLNIGLFSDFRIKVLLEKIDNNNTISHAHKTSIKSFVSTLYEVKQKALNDTILKEKIIFYEEIPDYGEKFRFASVNNDKSNKHKALIWVIPDFRKEKDEEEIMFESACFKTQDMTIIDMLNQVFQDAKEKKEEDLQASKTVTS